MRAGALIVAMAGLTGLQGATLAGMIPVFQARSVFVRGVAHDGTTQVMETDSRSAPGFAAFDDAIWVRLEHGQATAEASASQRSIIAPSRFEIRLSAAGGVQTGSAPEAALAQASSHFYVQVRFTEDGLWRVDGIVRREAGGSTLARISRLGFGPVVELTPANPETHGVIPLPAGDYLFETDAQGEASVLGGPAAGGGGATVGIILRDAALLCAGDVTEDGAVNFADLNAVLSNFGATGVIGFVVGDANFDGRVDFADLNLVLGFFGQPCPS